MTADASCGGIGSTRVYLYGDKERKGKIRRQSAESTFHSSLLGSIDYEMTLFVNNNNNIMIKNN